MIFHFTGQQPTKLTASLTVGHHHWCRQSTPACYITNAYIRAPFLNFNSCFRLTCLVLREIHASLADGSQCGYECQPDVAHQSVAFNPVPFIAFVAFPLSFFSRFYLLFFLNSSFYIHTQTHTHTDINMIISWMIDSVVFSVSASYFNKLLCDNCLMRHGVRW